MSKVMEVFRPGAVVLQCGADSLSGDRLGCFNLTVKGHAECVRCMRSFNVPLRLLGGGGYTICNVARCWCYETGVALGIEIDDKMPQHEYIECFGPDYPLHVAPSNMENKNSQDLLEAIRAKLLENLSKLQHAPTVQFQERPPETELPEESGDGDEDEDDKHERKDPKSDINAVYDRKFSPGRAKQEFVEYEANDKNDVAVDEPANVVDSTIIEAPSLKVYHARSTDIVSASIETTTLKACTLGEETTTIATDAPHVEAEQENSKKLNDQPAEMDQKLSFKLFMKTT